MAIINGTSGDDWFGDALEGLPEDDSYFGFAGTDWLIASLGNDTLDGGADGDLGIYDRGLFTSGVFINNTDGTIEGIAAHTVDKRGFGTDTLVDMENFHGTNVDDVIYLGNNEDGTYSLDLSGDDLVVAYQGLDAGDDHHFVAGSGNDTYIGTIHRDRVDYNWQDGGGDSGGDITQGVNVDLSAETATDGWGDTDTLISVERVTGTRFDDIIRGDDGRNDFNGLEGDDILDGRGGDRDRAEYGDDPNGVIADLEAGTATDGWGDTDTLIDIERLRGSRYDDVLRGDDGRNDLYGHVGDDTLIGRGGDDYLEGGDGADTIDGGDGFDVIGHGDDTDDGGTGAVTVDLQAGTAIDGWGNTDTLTSIEGADGSEAGDTLAGDENDNFLDGREGDDTLLGRGGRDTFRGSAGDDTIDGGDGDDRVEYHRDADRGGSAGVTVDLEAGTATDGFGDTDTLISIEDVRGTDSADTITGDDADNDIEGLGGDDVISTGAGRDWIRPGAGSDTIDGGSEPGMYDGDQVNYDDEEATTGITVTFSSDDDATVTDWNGDTDTLIDIEEVYGTRFADTMTGAEGRQWLGGGEGDDVLSGLGDDDDLMAGDGDDELYGGDGRDYLQPGAGVDFIDGGSEPGEFGGDTIVYRHDDNITGGVTVTWSTDDDGTAIDWTGATDTFVDVEGARGTEFADTMTGSEGRQQLQGEGGDDMLIGGDGDDDLSGGDGDDTLDGGQGGDFLQPGAGSDTIIGGENGPEGQTDTVAFIHTNNVTGGVDVVFSGELAGTIADYSGGTDTFTGVEQIWGTNFADTFTGAEGRQRFTGFGGDDTFDGGAGDQDRVSYEREQEDVGASQGIVVDLAAGTATDAYGDTDTLIGIEEIRGTDFDDVITGDGNRNELQGDDGDDIIDGGGGDNNYLDGGNGNDTLIARGDQNYVDGGDGDDTITFIGGPSGGADPGIGSDTITGVAGGWNRLEYRSLTGSVTIDIEAGTTVKSDGGTDNFTNIRTVGGGSGEDTLLGSDREDYEGFRASQGDDFIDGRGGYDDLRLFNSDEANLIVNFATGTVTGDFTGTDTFVNIEGATGSLNDDTFIGSDLDNIEFRGLQGDDTFTGGAGIEQISYEWDQFWDDGQNGVVVNLATGTATDGFGDTDTFTDIENLHGSAFDDMLTGDDGVNEIMDGEGDDTVDAAGGDDTLIIGLGTDTLTGGTGADVFEGTIEALDGDTIADFSLEDSFSILDPAGIQIGADITTDGTNFYIDIDGDGTADATVINGSGYTGLVNSEGGPAGGPVAAVIAVANAGFFTASVTEGNAGSAVAEVTLTRSGDVFAEVEVSYEIAGFGGNPADSADVTGFGTGSVTFMPGQEELTVSIEVLGDTTIEANEDLRLTVTSASSDGVLPAEIDGDETYVRILNDDVPPLVEVIGSRATEDSGAPLTFTFNRDADDLSGDLIVAYRLRGGDNDTDADPDDLVDGLPRFGSITIEAGETSAVLELEIVADGVLEPHETVYAEILSLDGPGAAGYEIGAGEATASIRNDDGIPPEFPIGQSAGNYGDPHLITLDGLAYDFQAVGEFTLLEAVSGDPLDIQVRYRPVEGSDVATRTTAVAMDMDDVRLVFDLDALSLIRVDGADLDLGAGGVASIGDAGGALYFDGEVYTVVFSTGDQVRITARDTFLDLSVGLTGGRDVRGLLGNGDGDAANDLALRDGTVLDQPVSFEDLYGAYADSWRITDGISLFDYADGEGTADFTDTSFPVGAISLDDIPEALLAAAQEAAAGIEDPVIRDAAILDFILSGDDSYIDAAEEVTTEVMDDTAPMDAPMIASAIGVSASASEVIEGDEGSQTVLYTLFRTGDLSETVEVSYGFTGDAGASDVSGLTSGTIAFEAGQSEQTVEVSVLGDGIDEGDEAFIFSFDVTEGSPLVLSSQATVTIVDDDTATSEIEGTDRPDFLTGTDGDDVIRPLGGAVNLVAGGEGSDLFVFEGDSDDGMRQRYLITDYEVGVDGLSLGDAEIAGFTTRSNSVVIELAGDVPDKIVVFGIDSFDDLTIV